MHHFSGGHFAIYWGGLKYHGVSGLSPQEILVATPFKLLQNMGNALLDKFVIYLKS